MKTDLQQPTIRFQSRLLESGMLAIPSDFYEKLPEGATALEGVVNHFPFRAPISPEGLELTPTLKEAAKLETGDATEVEVTRIGDEAEVRVPSDFRSALGKAPDAYEQWKNTTTKARRDWILWMLTAKLEKTRQTRIANGCDMLSSGKKRVCCFGGLSWLNKDHPIAAQETWQL